MRFGTDIQLRSVAAWYPPDKETAKEAVAEDRLDAEIAERLGVTEVPVSHELAAPEMAVKAAHVALERGECSAEEIDVLIHAWLYYQGHDLWSPPHYIANQLNAKYCLPIAIHQGCDGGALALQDAALRLSSEPSLRNALVTSADRFTLPGIDRWNCQPSLALGDGATAVLLRRSETSGSPFRLRAINTRSAVELEVMNRGSMPFGDYPMAGGFPADQREISHDAIELLGKDRLYSMVRKQVRSLLFATLDDIGITADSDQLQAVVLPRIGMSTVESVYLSALEELSLVDKLRFAESTGHLGCGDWGADLNDLYERNVLEPGRHAVLIGAGGGFTWACIAVQAL